MTSRGFLLRKQRSSIFRHEGLVPYVGWTLVKLTGIDRKPKLLYFILSFYSFEGKVSF